MTIVYTDAHKAHDPKFEIYDGQEVAYPEVAERAETIIDALRQQDHQIIAPTEYSAEHLLAVHQPQYVEFVKERSQGIAEAESLYPSYFMTDTYAPMTRGTYDASIAAVNAALTGADKLLGGEAAVYSLCRPPGHHAEHHSMGGYCYFNNAAVAAHYLSKQGTVAILDIDYHHGNGTQDIFYDRDDVLYVSLHADPTDNYPYASGFADEVGRGPGKGFTINYPLPKTTDDDQYAITLQKALDDIKQFGPDFMVVSVGFDTFKDDPIAGLNLDVPSYAHIGSMIAGLTLPSLLIQEGGYNVEHLGEMADAFLSSFRPA